MITHVIQLNSTGQKAKVLRTARAIRIELDRKSDHTTQSKSARSVELNGIRLFEQGFSSTFRLSNYLTYLPPADQRHHKHRRVFILQSLLLTAAQASALNTLQHIHNSVTSAAVCTGNQCVSVPSTKSRFLTCSSQHYVY